jgi:hypothetical protein
MRLLALSFALAAACATGKLNEASGPTRDCGPMTPAVAARGAAVLDAPDSTANILATMHDPTPVCASSDARGFGFRRVRLADGRTGFIDEGSLE